MVVPGRANDVGVVMVENERSPSPAAQGETCAICGNNQKAHTKFSSPGVVFHSFLPAGPDPDADQLPPVAPVKFCQTFGCFITEPHKHVTVGAAPEQRCKEPDDCVSEYPGFKCIFCGREAGKDPSPPPAPAAMSEEDLEETDRIFSRWPSINPRGQRLLAEARRARRAEEALRKDLDEEQEAYVREVTLGEQTIAENLALEAENKALREALEEIEAGAPLTREPSGWRCRYCGYLDSHNAVCPIHIARAALGKEK